MVTGGRARVVDHSSKGWGTSPGEAGERTLFQNWFHGWISSSSAFPGPYLVCMHRDKNPFLASPLNSFPLYNFTVYLRGHLKIQPWTRTPFCRQAQSKNMLSAPKRFARLYFCKSKSVFLNFVFHSEVVN